MVQEVHDEALDVGAVMVLIRHDHQVPVAQLLRAIVALQQDKKESSVKTKTTCTAPMPFCVMGCSMPYLLECSRKPIFLKEALALSEAIR